MQHPHPPAGARVVLLALCLFALAAPWARADEPPRFLLERITVAGNRRPASAHIVVSESLLTPGRSYSEDELRDSIHRIKRLPFVIDADFSLQKGSERGRYELVVTIEETRPLFANFDVAGVLTREPILDTSRGLRRFDYTDGSLFGFREPVGSYGFLFASLANPNGLYQVGYTQYDLFGHGSFASLSVAYNPDLHAYTPTLSAGVPLTVNQSLRATVSLTRATDRQSFFRSDGAGQSEQLSWLYNTTDDPLFPTQGDDLQASLVYQSSHDFARSRNPDFPGTSRSDFKTWALAWSGTHHRPLSARQSAGLSFTAQGSRSEEDFSFFGDLTTRSYGGSLEALYDFDFWQGTRARRWGDLRFEGSLGYAVAYDTENAASRFASTEHQVTVGASLVFRNPWALVRVGATYYGKARR